MTVAELISKLTVMPAEAEILLANPYGLDFYLSDGSVDLEELWGAESGEAVVKQRRVLIS